MDATLLKSVVALLPICLLVGWAVVVFRRRPTVWSLVQLFGAGCLLMVVLARERGKVLTHRMLLERVWGPEHAAQAQCLRVYVDQLRRYLEADAARPRLIATEAGVDLSVHRRGLTAGDSASARRAGT